MNRRYRQPMTRSMHGPRAHEDLPLTANTPGWGRKLLLGAIRGYQRWISPYKGFCCAYRQHTGRASCSHLGFRVVRRHGVVAGLQLLRQRMALCGVAHRRYAPWSAPRFRPQAQRGDCDVGCCDLPGHCDLPCDFDVLQGKSLARWWSGCGDFANCCNCCDCFGGKRWWSRGAQHDECTVHLPPRPLGSQRPPDDDRAGTGMGADTDRRQSHNRSGE